ncbi:hypothetical protein [Halalkalibacter okhensis]|uniref:Uncharacterized protein n=1 Tax=Halalkalibacter okhensis TaxID=333138 RepID=A0A0B0IKH6_9BACI|nr:hypothetical protein [Halalkalibacter okhensis]KHF41795.1 hypothetical protein LQ50_00390 [Halalkalibacter okhensis]
MKKKNSNNQSRHSDLLQNILLLENITRREKRRSPTIAELATLVGDSEEHILECLELGRSTSPTNIH